jgi:tRNA(fMet)-specific endonuclease VapC
VNEIVIVDTDVVSYLFKGDTRAEAYRQHLQGKTLAISFMTVAELYQWAYVRNWGSKKLARFEEKLRSYIIVPYLDRCYSPASRTLSGHPQQ